MNYVNQQQKPAISIAVLVYNEKGNMEPTVQNIINAAEGYFSDYEILIIDCVRRDGTDDGTRASAEQLARENPKIKSVQNPYVSVGYKYWKGVDLAKFEYYAFFPGDNEISAESIKEILRPAGKTDMVLAYTVNREVRSFKRRFFSKTYIFLLNLMFGLKIKYYNGPSVMRTSILKSLPDSAKKDEGFFDFHAEAVIRMLKTRKATYLEIPMYLQPRAIGESKALTGTHFKHVFKRIGKLFWEIMILRKRD
jgi:glycosyltransferase involved in cell wall biosynthesis